MFFHYPYWITAIIIRLIFEGILSVGIYETLLIAVIDILFAFDTFYGFPENPINPGMRDIGDCRLAKPTYRATITNTPTGHISWCDYHGTHTLNACLSIYLLHLPNPKPLGPPELPLPLKYTSRAVKRIQSLFENIINQ
jgi:hypothetical protein